MSGPFPAPDHAKLFIYMAAAGNDSTFSHFPQESCLQSRSLFKIVFLLGFSNWLIHPTLPHVSQSPGICILYGPMVKDFPSWYCQRFWQLVTWKPGLALQSLNSEIKQHFVGLTFVVGQDLKNLSNTLFNILKFLFFQGNNSRQQYSHVEVYPCPKEILIWHSPAKGGACLKRRQFGEPGFWDYFTFFGPILGSVNWAAQWK